MIFDELLARKRPFCSGGELRVLSELRNPDEVLGTVRASCSVPLLNGAPHYHSALHEGATHVLVLRSRDAGYRLPPYRGSPELAFRLASPGAPLVAPTGLGTPATSAIRAAAVAADLTHEAELAGRPTPVTRRLGGMKVHPMWAMPWHARWGKVDLVERGPHSERGFNQDREDDWNAA